MTKAQSVRYNRLNAITDCTNRAKQIFNWILDLMDSDTQRGHFEPINVQFSSHCNFLQTVKDSRSGKMYGEQYPLPENFSEHDCLKLFTTLKGVVEQEEGYTAHIKKSEDCIIFQVVIS